MRKAAVLVVVVLGALSALADSATAATKKKQPPPPPQSPVLRSAAGTVIEPTKTIIHDQYGHTTVIVVPRRSYLDPGTEVSVGEGSDRDYMLPPGGDPGRPNWFYGPDVRGAGSFPLPGPFYIPGFNPNTPF
jgi:hypothetical protein